MSIATGPMSASTAADLKTCIVELADHPVGILQRTHRGYVFSSTDTKTAKLDGRRFESVARGIKSARECVARASGRDKHVPTK